MKLPTKSEQLIHVLQRIVKRHTRAKKSKSAQHNQNLQTKFDVAILKTILKKD